MSRPLAATLSLLLSLPSGTALAEAMPAPSEGNSLWGMGATGMQCYHQPCPWRSIFPIHQDGSHDRPLSSDDMDLPPPLEASDTDRARIEAAFETGGCVIVDGRLDSGTMIVARVLGEC